MIRQPDAIVMDTDWLASPLHEPSARASLKRQEGGGPRRIALRQAGAPRAAAPRARRGRDRARDRRRRRDEDGGRAGRARGRSPPRAQRGPHHRTRRREPPPGGSDTAPRSPWVSSRAPRRARRPGDHRARRGAAAGARRRDGDPRRLARRGQLWERAKSDKKARAATSPCVSRARWALARSSPSRSTRSPRRWRDSTRGRAAGVPVRRRARVAGQQERGQPAAGAGGAQRPQVSAWSA